MPIAIQYQANAATQAFTMQQRFAVVGWGNDPLGTSNLAFCLGLLVHAPQQRVTALAHVEAQATQALYIADLGRSFRAVRDKLLARGASGALEVVLCGNFHANADFSTNLEAILFSTFHQSGCTLAAADVIDCRVPQPGNGHVVGQAPAAGAVMAGTALFDPAGAGTLFLWNGGVAPKAIGFFDKAERFAIQ